MASKSTIYKGLNGRTEFVNSMLGGDGVGMKELSDPGKTFERLGSARNSCTYKQLKNQTVNVADLMRGNISLVVLKIAKLVIKKDLLRKPTSINEGYVYMCYQC